MFCQKCGKAIIDESKFCYHCGIPSAESQESAPEQSAQESQEYYEAAIGYKRPDYYLPIFSRFDTQGVGISWNWPAFFISLWWLLYRKMWGWAFLYWVVSAILGSLAAAFPLLLVVYLGVLFVAFPMYANALYYRHVNKKIAKVNRYSEDKERRLRILASEGGAGGAVLIVLLVIVFTAIIGIFAAIAIPAYQHYMVRASLVSAISYGTNATSAVSAYYSMNSKVPNSLGDAGFVAPLPESVKAIHLNDKGVVSITLNISPVKDKDLLFVPSLDDNQEIQWRCTSQEIPEQYLPSRCR